MHHVRMNVRSEPRNDRKRRMGLTVLSVLAAILTCSSMAAEQTPALLGQWPLIENANDTSGSGHHGVVETTTGEEFATTMKRRGSVGRPLLLWAARRYGRMSLKKAGEVMGGMDYTAVAMATRRFEAKARKDPHLQEIMEKVRTQCAM